MANISSIPPKLLHKSSANDVLLENPRKVLPVEVHAVSPSAVSTAENEAISRFYRSVNQNRFVLNRPPIQGEVTGLPFAAISEPHSSGAARGVPHQVIAQMIHSGNPVLPQDYSLNDRAIEAFLTHHKVRGRSTSFTLINRADHYFFYGKPHEHVPGIMLLEAARQTAYYQLYTYSGHALGDVTVSLSELNAKFHAYGELMYPIEIVLDDLTEFEERRPRKVRYLASFFQRGSLIAEIETVAPVIPLKLFKTARNACLLNDTRYAPLPNAPVISLITAGDTQEIVVLRQIAGNCCVTAPPRHVNATQAYLSVIYDSSLSFRTAIHRVGSSDSGIAWTFGPIKYNELENLKEIIKRGFLSSEAENRPELVSN